MGEGAAVATTDAADARLVLEFQAAGGAWWREPVMPRDVTLFEEALPARPSWLGKRLRSFAGWWLAA
jgi:hypothetical protein